jgi:hypothetical protein
MNIFNQATYSELKKNCFKAYLHSFNEFLEFYNNYQSLNEIIDLIKENSQILKSHYNNKALYFLSEAYKMASLIEPLIDLENGDADEEDVKVFLYDELTSTQYGKDFLEFNEVNKDIIKSTQETLDLFKEQLICFFNIHFLNRNQIDFPMYREIFEIGDRFHVNSLEKFKIKKIDFDLYLYTDDFKKQSERIQKAINTISEYSPESYEKLTNFTKYIAVLDDEDFVSYSSQYLPEHSAINLYHRDDLDLIDDLLHENGHHHMNHYLNYVELINEDDEQIYYSPWRKTLRPIRGIYHAVFTFYNAFKVYHDLLNSDFIKTSNNEVKIIKRFFEEKEMLLFCKADLEHAFENDKITERGKFIIDYVYELIELQKDNISTDQVAKIKNDTEIIELIKNLEFNQENKAY